MKTEVEINLLKAIDNRKIIPIGDREIIKSWVSVACRDIIETERERFEKIISKIFYPENQQIWRERTEHELYKEIRQKLNPEEENEDSS